MTNWIFGIFIHTDKVLFSEIIKNVLLICLDWIQEARFKSLKNVLNNIQDKVAVLFVGKQRSLSINKFR